MAKKEEMLQRLDGLLSGPARNPRREAAPASPDAGRAISAQELERRSLAGRKPSWDRERLTANRTYTSLSLDSESYSKIREIARINGLPYKDLIDAAMRKFVELYEERHGPVVISGEPRISADSLV